METCSFDVSVENTNKFKIYDRVHLVQSCKFISHPPPSPPPIFIFKTLRHCTGTPRLHQWCFYACFSLNQQKNLDQENKYTVVRYGNHVDKTLNNFIWILLFDFWSNLNLKRTLYMLSLASPSSLWVLFCILALIARIIFPKKELNIALLWLHFYLEAAKYTKCKQYALKLLSISCYFTVALPPFRPLRQLIISQMCSNFPFINQNYYYTWYLWEKRQTCEQNRASSA